ncbi:MAG: metallophosphoesterase family protein [Planctomycetia bacterium]|nr:metallophosphoesterase family protein [Planctomycetia bacterium]
MKKILLLILTLAFSLTEAGAVEIPDWAKTQIADAKTRFEAWKGDDSVVSFTVITDVHSRQPALIEPADFSDTKMHVLFTKEIADAMNADFCADLGDIELEMVPKTPEEVETRIQAQLTLYGQFTRPVLFAMGNHDHAKGRIVSSARYGELFNGLAAKNGHEYHFGPDKSIGYYEIAEKKFRIYFLNTSDDGYYAYSVPQLQFVADTLKTVPEGWTVIALQHYCMQNSIGHWKSCNTYAKFRETGIQLFEAFLAREKGGSEGVTWDFTGVKEPKMVGMFCGDSHFSHQKMFNGVNYVITQGYGGVRLDDMADGARHVLFSRGKEMLIDFVVVKPEKREVKIFRVGAGGADYDREFTY